MRTGSIVSLVRLKVSFLWRLMEDFLSTVTLACSLEILILNGYISLKLLSSMSSDKSIREVIQIELTENTCRKFNVLSVIQSKSYFQTVSSDFISLLTVMSISPGFLRFAYLQFFFSQNTR